MSYELGSVYRATFTVTDATGTLIDPAVKTVTVTLPDQSTATATVVRDSLGTFHADYTILQEGLHKIGVVTTTPTTARTDYFNAAAWRSVIGVDEAKAFVNDDQADKDPILRQIMGAATELAESVVGSCVPRRFVNERVPGRNAGALRLPHGPLPSASAVESITSVWPNGPTWTPDQLIVYPDSGTVEVSSFWLPFWYGPWMATYTAGRLIIPESIQLAVKEIVFDMWAIQRPYGSAQLEPGPDDTARFEQMVASYRMPPHAAMLLSPYEMPGFA